jgi:hypothetical protein
MVFPKSFFEIGTQRAMPYVSYITKPTYRNEALSLLPADPGDELWLFDRFFAEYYSDGGNIDCVSTSVSAGQFCLDQTSGIHEDAEICTPSASPYSSSTRHERNI